MTKSEAIHLFGGVTNAAKEIGVTPSAISQWPEDLPQRLVDRVQAALFRRGVTADQLTTHPAAPKPAQKEAA